MEGGNASIFRSEREALDLLMEAIERVNKRHMLNAGVIALDVAASQFITRLLVSINGTNKKNVLRR